MTPTGNYLRLSNQDIDKSLMDSWVSSSGAPEFALNCTLWLPPSLSYFFFSFFRAAPTRGQIRAAAAGLHHSHSNAGSELHLHPTPQLMAMPDPSPTKQGQGWNPCPHGC